MELVERLEADDKSRKYVYQTDDGYLIEAGYYDLDEHIVCISTQIGCAMECSFCATTYADEDGRKIIRNLYADEIVEQVS